MEENERFYIHKLSVCGVCIHLMANGEYNDGTNAAEKCAEGQEKEWGEYARYLIAGSNCEESPCPWHECEGDCTQLELGFSGHWCEGCGNTDAGDRFRAYCMIPKNR